jgi:uncharacterized protein YbgA (DUF1722 family)
LPKHRVHKYVLMTHSREGYRSLGRLVAQAHRYTPKKLAALYERKFMTTLAVKATRHKHVDVLQHLIGHLKKQLLPNERGELDELLRDYHRRLVPPVVPVTLIKHHVGCIRFGYIQSQVYLNPHPKELMLRNHV